MNHAVYISAGSNLGDRVSSLREAVRQLEQTAISVRRVSNCFETEPVGFSDQPWFLNLGIEVHTTLSPLELLDHCQAIEQKQGRIRSFKNAPRTLDLDILLYDDLVMSTPRLTIPHPLMTERRFVLVPLAQIAPNLVHPLSGLTIRSLLKACNDQSQVRPCSASIP